MTNIAASQLGLSLATLGSTQSTQAQAALGVKGKAKEAAQNFEANFLSSMFQDMFTGIDGDGPFGGSGSLKIWRSFMTDQMAKSFAKAGGIGIAPMVYDTLLKEQGLKA